HFTLTGTSTVAGVSHSLGVTARDADGNIATGYLGTVHFTSSDPSAVLPAEYTFTANDACHHVLSVTLKTAGSRSITATDTLTASTTGTLSLSLHDALPISHFTLTGTSTVAGVSHSLGVNARDAYGNIATGYLGTVHFTSSD